MDHPNQNTMLLPASYAVISEEEMTYLDGGQSIYLGSAFNHDIYCLLYTSPSPRDRG